jgi:phosphate starvation-inducible PhoH-like protein
MKKANKQNNIKYSLYAPKNSNQLKYVNYLNDNKSKIIVSLGPAGTGKTLFSCQKAINKLKCEEINKIILTRPVVTVEEEIGFLPGNIIKKMDPWTKPIFDIFLEYYSKTELDLMLSSGKIEICPLAFMRGRTFKDAFILADEMQNSSPVQMKMLTTRIGDNSMLVITGDLNQTDYHHKENGLYDFVKKVEYYNNTDLVKIIRFNDDDIERSEIVKKVIEIYNYVKPKEKKAVKSITSSNIPGINYNNDAALMPKHHVTHNFDIIFETREF